MPTPTKRTPENAQRLLYALYEGATLAEAAAATGLDDNTVWRWRQEDPDFRATIEKCLSERFRPFCFCSEEEKERRRERERQKAEETRERHAALVTTMERAADLLAEGRTEEAAPLLASLPPTFAMGARIDSGRYEYGSGSGWMKPRLLAREPRPPRVERARCGARTRKGTPCRCQPVEGKRRCRYHGGLSTGPKTAEGRRRIAESNRRRASQRRMEG